MGDLDTKALRANFQNWKNERGAGLSQGKAFERYVFEQVLKDFDPADEDLDVGDLGGEDDGGCDGLFFYIGGQLMSEETSVPEAATDVVLHLIQAKFETSFRETVIEKFESFIRDLLAYDRPIKELSYLNSKAKDAIATFRSTYDKIIGRPHTLSFFIHYVCIASDIPDPKDKVYTRADNIKRHIKSVMSAAKVEFSPWSAATLMKSVRTIPDSKVVVPCSKSFSTADKSTVCLVKLRDFFEFILSREDGSLQTRFLEPNVRDYQGRSNPVNSAIRATLEQTHSGEEFWWLNNGITILSTDCTISGDKVRIDNPEIVNGLQTSHEIYNYFHSRKGVQDSRHILLRVIVSDEDAPRNRIIKATNSQTKVTDLSLLSTEPIQQIIDDRLKLHGLFYDRKKGQCRRLKRPIQKIVGMKSLAQAVIAIVLRHPDQARGRPETYIKNHASEVFSSEYDGDLFVSCVLVDRQVESYLTNSATLDFNDRRNLRHYMNMYLASMLTGLRKPHPDDISKLSTSIQSIEQSHMKAALEDCSVIYKNCGGDDQAAKGSSMTGALEERIKTLLP